MLKEGEVVQEIEYRNLAPLYAEEPLRVCGRVEDGRSRTLELWIENAAGGYSVRGVARIGAITS
jgi:hydroxyacyl-ACP dehydratase HTD2-like protein with hotdog domain